MLGEIDWDRMNVVGRGPAFIWLAAFTIFIPLFMLNMLLSIVSRLSLRKNPVIRSAHIFDLSRFVWLGGRRFRLIG